MEHLLQTIVQQNEQILSVLEQISEKLDVLGTIEHEMSWSEDLTTASQLLKAIDSVADAVQS